jgi:anti-sigma B factor antagonist
MTCTRCGLSLRLRGAPPSLDRCPRCFAFAGVSVPLRDRSVSPLTSGATPVAASVPPAPTPAFGHLVVSTERFGEATVIALQGKLDIASERCLEQALRRALATSCTEIVIDLRGLEFIDAAGMKVLLNARDHMVECGSRLFLTPGPSGVQRMFQLTGTLDLFSFRT